MKTTIKITTTATTWTAWLQRGNQRKLRPVASGPIARLTAGDCRSLADSCAPCWWQPFAPAIYSALAATLKL